MPNAPIRKTAYEEYVYSNLPARVAEGQGLYNYKELAAMVGLKPTQHFKRRVNHLVDLKALSVQHVFTPRGGIESRFCIFEDQSIGELPF